MRFLITGASGSVGQALTLSLLEKGYMVRAFDRNVDKFRNILHKNLEVIKGKVEERSLVKEAVKGIDVIVHLAWSFSDDPMVLLDSDLKGHVIILEEAAAVKVSHFFYTSTAVVYGKAVCLPVTEEAPCLVEDARKPFYGSAKLMAEKLALVFWKTQGLPVTIFRFWWAYGEDIGGRHLRDMIELATAGQPLVVPEGAGGSFLYLEDLTNAVMLATQKQRTFGEIFNLSTLYLTWEEIARMILDITNSSSSLQVVPLRDWKGSQFLSDNWELSTGKAEQLFNYHSLLSPDMARQRLKEAIRECYRRMSKEV